MSKANINNLLEQHKLAEELFAAQQKDLKATAEIVVGNIRLRVPCKKVSAYKVDLAANQGAEGKTANRVSL